MSAPRIGDTVHYRSFGTPGGEYLSECRAAIVTEVHHHGEDREDVSLAVLNPTGLFFDRYIRHDENKSGGSWHYRCTPPKEEE